MRINKPIVNYKDWKTKVIIGYVLIIALFCVATDLDSFCNRASGNGRDEPLGVFGGFAS